MPRRADIFLAMLVALVALMLGMLGHASYAARASEGVREHRAGLVRELGLTDLCLFAEARYTRNPVLADRHSAFQDHPSAMEHFPSGALMPPPPHLKTDTQNYKTPYGGQ